MAKPIKIVVAKCRPQEPVHQTRRNYCADCGYPIMWTETWGWIAARTPDPEYGVFLAPPTHRRRWRCWDNGRMSQRWVVTPQEWYPILDRDDDQKVDGEWARQIELTDEDAAFITQVQVDFTKAQEILQAAYDAARSDGSADG